MIIIIKEIRPPMDDGSKPPLAGLLILLILSAFWAFAETAFASVSRNKVKVASEHGDSRAKKVLSILDNFDKAITTILICNNITSVVIATVVTVYVTRRFGINFVSISTILTTIVIFFACEMLPKSLAKKNSFKISLFCAGLISFLMKIFTPVSSILTSIGNRVAQKAKDEYDEISVTEDELQDIIEDMTEDGALNEEESDLISSAIQYGDTTVKKILTPMSKVESMNVDLTPEEQFEFLRKQKHSRIPLYKDTPSNIIGILRLRTYFKAYVKNHNIPNVKRIADNVFYTYDNTEISELLPLMSEHRTNICIIKNSKEENLGIVTVEDILEELFGEIYDEKDIVDA